MTEAQGLNQPFPGSERFTNVQVSHLSHVIGRASTEFESILLKGMVQPIIPQIAIADGDVESAGDLVRKARAIAGRGVALETAMIKGEDLLWEDTEKMLGRGNVSFENIPSMVLDYLAKRYFEQQEREDRNRINLGIATVSVVKRFLVDDPGNLELIQLRRRQKQAARVAQVAAINRKLKSGIDGVSHGNKAVPLTDRKRARIDALRKRLQTRIPVPQEV